jgi:tetratricopeptide (TPR) repeat protein
MFSCKKCGSEMNDTSLFCNKCGKKVSSHSGIKLPKKGIIYSSIGALIVAVVVFLVVLNNNPVEAFTSAIKSNKYGEAVEVYNQKIKGDTVREKEVNQSLLEEIQTIKTEYVSDEIDFTTAANRLDTILNTKLLQGEVNNAKREIKRIEDSRIAFKTGNEFLALEKIREAIMEFKKVIKEDEQNFEKANQLILSSADKYKASVLEEIESLVSQEKFIEALQLISAASLVISDDADFKSKRSILEAQLAEKKAQERKAKMKELEESQEVIVVSTETFTDWLDDINLSIVIKNNSDKVIKKYVVAWMGYDKNGYPVKTGWLSPAFLKEGNAEMNVQPSKTFGKGYGWEIDQKDAKKFLAVVKEVEYYDGSIWNNPYYDYWVEEYKEKPLNQ